MAAPGGVTKMIQHETIAQDGRRQVDARVPELYAELRRIAAYALGRENSGHTLQPTALVHEAYLRLAKQQRLRPDNDAQLLGLAAHFIRCILTDHARRRGRQRRGGGWKRVTLSGVALDERVERVDLVELADLLDALERRSERQARIVELRLFAGLSFAEIGRLVGASTGAVHGEWRFARAWLLARCVDTGA